MHCCGSDFQCVGPDLISAEISLASSITMRSLPMEIPFADNPGYCHFTYTPNDTPGPQPGEGDESDKPARIRSNVEYPGIVTTEDELG